MTKKERMKEWMTPRFWFGFPRVHNDLTPEEYSETQRSIAREPFIELPLQALKVRRNLLLCSILCVAVFFGASIEDFNTGAKITGFPVQHLDWALFVVTIYFWVYFRMIGYTAYERWHFRLTGKTHTSEQTLGDSTPATDFNIDQSTQFDIIHQQLEAVRESMLMIMKNSNLIINEKRQHLITAKGVQLDDDVEKALKGIYTCSKNIEGAHSNLNKIASKLNKFMIAFSAFQKGLRWNFYMEFHLPLLLGFGSLLLMFFHFASPPQWSWNQAQPRQAEIRLHVPTDAPQSWRITVSPPNIDKESN